ncbi:hypothetical protein Cva_01108 [Caedimonas varicaedens]|jgi:hypothetical protein|uniref:Uncharacterized protein n=1 Tax=Caedimonas varicaedens TaxID=1629334 RepID=A0A0K8ME29_9PROT|nr:hypothetical protein Cva_01108 [Caedimonas varicaedens]
MKFLSNSTLSILFTFIIIGITSQSAKADILCVEAIETKEQANKVCSKVCNVPYFAWFGEWHKKSPICINGSACVCEKTN